MLGSLALMTLLQAPTLGAGDLSLANVRFTLGMLGPTRTDTKVRPGDSVCLSFDIQGISADAAGKVSYSTAVEVLDAKGKVLFKQPARKLQEFLPLGGEVLPAFAHIDLAPDSPPGEYTMKVAVVDLTSTKSTSVSTKFEVLSKGFDLVRISIAGDGEGLVPIGAYCVGQPFWVHAAAVGFERSPQGSKQPKVSLMLRVLDEAGKPIVAKPFSGVVDKDVAPTAASLPIRFFVPLNKAGNYWVELVATDELKDTTVSRKFPITVVASK